MISWVLQPLLHGGGVWGFCDVVARQLLLE